MARDPDYEPADEVTAVRREEAVREGPPRPPWWRENWWIWGLLLLLFVAALIAFFALRAAADDDDENGTRTVPELIGLQEDDAVSRVEDLDLDADVRETPSEGDEPGTVVDQSPEAGTEVETGTRVLLIVAEEEETETETETQTQTETVAPEAVEVPDVVGLDHVEAGAQVDDAGLVANTFPVPSEEDRGTVVAQNPDPGTELNEGSAVRLNVSLGPGERGSFEVPDVTGLEEAEARDRCRRARFTCLTVDRDAPSEEEVGEVLDQQPAAGTMADQLSQVRLFVGR
ncbi:MAG: PASTA domain-containing protein [Thermoleophilia bacterium]|nr:PASTA domain-containing protein [Thermoleophilia bacterium]